ncbi:prephenate dehydratase [Actinospica robiniae]|uniref:prephenate dehydratase n=1 Tax=Actinospica robiniae TaxID=304901 RepID=UPI0006845386|nr:prephenate dehydratase [Actinospica robiniae]
MVGRKRVAFQGEPGANSHIACREVYPEFEAVAYDTFDEGFASLEEGVVDLAMIPVENSTAGRVADIHRLLPESRLNIIGEHFLRVQHCLLALPGTDPSGLVAAYSHPQALAQCRDSLTALGLRAVATQDTAGAAREVAQAGDPTRGAIASRLAGEIFGLEVVREGLEDHPHNTTRFIILSREELRAAPGVGPIVTTLVFKVRNTPAALYKALGGFATNGVNMTKLESCMISGQFVATQFLADIEGHPDEAATANALEELGFYADYRILGVYRANPVRAFYKSALTAQASVPAPQRDLAAHLATVTSI